MIREQKTINYIRNIAFSNKYDSAISFSIILCLFFCVIHIFNWVLFIANWGVVKLNFPLYFFGTYPIEHRWRPCLWIFLIISLIILTLTSPRWPWIRRLLPLAWISIAPIGVYLLGGGLGLFPVGSRYWGGLTLTIFLTICSSLFSLPLGIVLALGRQSRLPIISKLSSIYIDTMRALPLISVLFFGQLLIPLFLPVGLEINRVSRAILAFTLFVSAYIAEDIRGGLQSIPRTQLEAGKVLGLNDFQIIRFIVLPQALRIALPALTNQAVGLLQNTSLMAILGLVELLGIGRSLLANPEFIGQYIEVYVWLAVLYWLVCTIMAILSRHLEQRTTLNQRTPS